MHGDDVFDPDLPEGLLHYKWAYVDGATSPAGGAVTSTRSIWSSTRPR